MEPEHELAAEEGHAVMAEDREVTSGEQLVARLYEGVEAQAARASETMVGSRGFAGMLGQLAENTAALTKLGSDSMDLVLRNLRVAGRRDVVRLARQLARTEDKLERVLQEVEQLRDELGRQHEASETTTARGRRSTRTTGARASRSGTSRADGGPANGSPSRQAKTTS